MKFNEARNELRRCLQEQQSVRVGKILKLLQGMNVSLSPGKSKPENNEIKYLKGEIKKLKRELEELKAGQTPG